MDTGRDLRVEWIVLTMGDRMDELRRAIQSIQLAAPESSITVVWNGCPAREVVGVDSIECASNVGVPGGRDLAARRSTADLIGFLDDDACLLDHAPPVGEQFENDQGLAAVALRIVDETGDTNRRHIPRVGDRGESKGGDVCNFLGGACVLRRSAYVAVGGYWTDLWYGHEELDLSWRLIDAGWNVRYVPDMRVLHPRTDITRHADGWRLTGRNRVWIARRDLPWPVAAIHTVAWLFIGLLRTPDRDMRRSYVRGWRSGWTDPIARCPVSWRTTWRLTRLGRPPIV